MVAEELARAWMSVASIIARAQGLGTGLADDRDATSCCARSARGDVDRRDRAVRTGRRIRPRRRQTRAERDGDDWVITGHKRWCGNAEAADFIQVLVRDARAGATTSRARPVWRRCWSRRSGAAFRPGLTGTPIDKIGYHGFLTWDLVFDGVRVPGGQRGHDRAPATATTAASPTSAAWLDLARVHTAARAVGLAQAAVEDCTAYLQEREQFGHPIGDFQALRFALADMASEVEQARAFYRQAAHLLDHRRATAPGMAAMAKLRATEMAATVTSQAMQLHGGNGYTTERAVERYWRDARLTTIFEGTSEIQRKIISDGLLPRPAREPSAARPGSPRCNTTSRTIRAHSSH